MDQAENPDSIVFWPGGFYNKENLICGHIGTISDTDGSKKIFKCFEKALKKYVVKSKEDIIIVKM